VAWPELGRRTLPDGRVLILYAHFMDESLTISTPEDLRLGVYTDDWSYQDHRAAVVALNEWDGEGDPVGWYSHHRTGRRRPDGDPEREYVAP
jgi:hypothetical protein